MGKPIGDYIQVTVHVLDSEPFMAQIDGLPGPADTFVQLRNPRTRDNKPVTWLSPNVQTVIYSAARITFIEVHGGEAATGSWIVRQEASR